MIKNRLIKVKFQKEGVHIFPGADTDPKYATGGWDDVSFLGYPHRHIFHFYIMVGVTHNDRDIEFIQFKRELERLYSEGSDVAPSNTEVLQLDYRSCEMIAEDLINYIEHKYPNRAVRVEVYEDDENGAILENDLFN